MVPLNEPGDGTSPIPEVIWGNLSSTDPPQMETLGRYFKIIPIKFFLQIF